MLSMAGCIQEGMEDEAISNLSDAELIAEVARLACGEREATVRLLVHLAELETRRLHLAAGFPSLFAYCTDQLRFSEDAAYNRVQAARAARRYPKILDLLADGSLSVTTVRLLSRHLTDENHASLVAAASGKSKREVEEMLARAFPQPDAPALVRRLPVVTQPAISPAGVAAPLVMPPAVTSAAPVNSGTSSLVPPPPLRPVQRPVVSPVAADRYRFTFTGGASTRQKLTRAQDLLRHTIPDGDVAAIFDRALTSLLQDLERKKCAATDRPVPSRGVGKGSRHIPAEVKRAVWVRDGGCCAFMGPGGRRCRSRAFLEYHHLKPYEECGEATVENIQLRCRAHNGYEAHLYYGEVKGLAERLPVPERPAKLRVEATGTVLSTGP
jgi:hypothetical protein